MPPEKIKNALSCLNASEKEFKKGGIIYRAGDTVTEIGLVEEGDIIDIDIPAAKVNVRVSDEELAERKKHYVPHEPNVKTGWLARYASLVSSAKDGAVMKF